MKEGLFRSLFVVVGFVIGVVSAAYDSKFSRPLNQQTIETLVAYSGQVIELDHKLTESDRVRGELKQRLQQLWLEYDHHLQGDHKKCPQ